jgi:hypothetical protein
MMEKIRVDTCPTLDEDLLDTQKYLAISPLYLHLLTFEREFGSPIVGLSLGRRDILCLSYFWWHLRIIQYRGFDQQYIGKGLK